MDNDILALEGTFHAIEVDPRPVQAQGLDHTDKEILGTGIVSLSWTIKKPTLLPRMYQWDSSACGGFSGSKGVTPFANFAGVLASANAIYRRRSNYPDAGMYIQDIGNILKNYGTCADEDFLSQSLHEAELNAMTLEQLGAALLKGGYKIGGYYMISGGKSQDFNMDLLAQALELGHSLVLGINSNGQEYTSQPISNNQATTFSHFVACIAKNYTLVPNTGEKALFIDDSCSPNTTIKDASGNPTGQRLFDETFLRARNWGVLALIPYSVPPSLIKPVHTFSHNLTVGMTDTDVVFLQDILKYEDFMKSFVDPNGKILPSTAYFGQATLAGVKKLQTKYASQILTPAGLTVPTGAVMQFTRAFLNSKYAN